MQQSPDLDDTRRHWIALWLVIVAAMIFIIVVLGGLTRLTHSGLSMVEWKPVTGWLPPLNEAEWEETFAKYRQYPEYQEINKGMTLTEFKGIFWLEFIHRVWGRIIGVSFFLPFVFFLAKRWVSGPLARHLGVIFVLGGLQGGLGWFMVKSGLVDRPDVSQYRLAAHLCLALIIFAYIMWVALRLKFPVLHSVPVGLRRGANGLIALIFVTIFSGALVAGLDAGLVYNTFPLMDGDLIPEGLFDQTPLLANFFENIITVQFEHRVLAIVTLVLVLYFVFRLHQAQPALPVRNAATALGAMAVAQVILGITTLLLVVPVSIAAIHQAGAVVLLGLAVWVRAAIDDGEPATP